MTVLCNDCSNVPEEIHWCGLCGRPLCESCSVLRGEMRMCRVCEAAARRSPTMQVDRVSREVIESQLLVALDDKSKVAVLLDADDLQLVITDLQHR